MAAAADQAAELAARDGELAIQGGLILPTFADKVADHADTTELLHKGEPECKRGAGVRGGAVGLHEGGRDVRVFELVLGQRDANRRKRREPIFLRAEHHRVLVLGDELALTAHDELHLPVGDEQHLVVLELIKELRGRRRLVSSTQHVVVVALQPLGGAASELSQLGNRLEARLGGAHLEHRGRHGLLRALEAEVDKPDVGDVQGGNVYR
ncbi:hypothetical protein Ctob_011465, partial [Chrysochromulina tobinii]